MTNFDPDVRTTKNGTRYLKEAGVALVAKPQFIPMNATPFVGSFGDTFDAADYENDFYVSSTNAGMQQACDQSIDHGAALCKLAGQTCYLSFGEKRSRAADAQRYFDNIKEQAHGSVLEHANYSFLVWGIDRAASHEAVRHRAGFGYSQLSQRYVNGVTLRFVERPEYQDNPELHETFESWIDSAAVEYERRARMLGEVYARDPSFTALPATERRKTVNQAARNCLPNETETAMVMTGNARSWRHFLEMRASRHADLPISRLALRIGAILKEVSPILFSDYTEETSPTGRVSLTTQYKKV